MLSPARRAAIHDEMAELWALFAPYVLDAEGNLRRIDAVMARPGVRLAWERWHTLNGRLLADRLPMPVPE